MKSKINISAMTDSEVLTRLKQGAEIYSEYVDRDLLFVYRRSKSSEYEYYQVHFGKENFMHLAGIKSEFVSAKEFFDLCMGNLKEDDEKCELKGNGVRELEMKYCTPSHDKGTMKSKIATFKELLDLKHGKLYKIGDKDCVTKYNDFDIAIGNNFGVIGCACKNSKKRCISQYQSTLAIPTTLLTKEITSYCSRPQKIIFILSKKSGDIFYNNLFYEIKENLFSQEFEKFMDEIKEIISPMLIST